MTDNEKRAHDLAVAISVEVCHLEASSHIANMESTKINYFEHYMNAYNGLLEDFNKHFPDGK